MTLKFFPFGFTDDGSHFPLPTKENLGGKGAGLVWMAEQGVTVPPGFVIPVSVWEQYDKAPKMTMKEIAKTLPEYLNMLKAHFGYLPLLSVRSGSRVSCPGMMDTILNVGIDDATQGMWIDRLGDKCFEDSYHRLVMMYGSVVADIKIEDLKPNLEVAKHEYLRQTGAEFPSAARQLLGAIEAVFKSWDNDRAKAYRADNKIPREWGTAVTVQAMVFGNLNDQSGTGVLFTRNPNTGECKVTGDFLPNAQGEDIVAGIRTPLSLDAMAVWNPTVHGALLELVNKLEKLTGDVQDIEFTIQDGVLYLLQTRSAKRSAMAALQIALDMTKSKLVSAKMALGRVTIQQFDQAQTAHLDPTFKKPAAFVGIAACNGIVTGKPVFTKEDAIECKEPCILIMEETTPEDIQGMYAAVGVITMVGGFTSHAAVVLRGKNKPCIVGLGQSVDVFKELDTISMDGATGQIWLETVPIIEGETNGLISEFSRLVFETLGAVPIISDVPKYKLDQALLYLGDKILHPEAAAKVVMNTLKKVGTLYLDLTPTPGSAEEDYLTLVATYNPAQRVLDLLDHTEKLTIVGGTETHGFKTLETVSDLRSLVLAESEMVIQNVDFQDIAIVKALAWKQQAGVHVVSLGKYLPEVKSFVSVSQTLPLVLKVGA